MGKSFAVVLAKVDGKYYVQLNRDKSVAASASVQEGIASIERSFNRNHMRSFEGSMSACIHGMEFQYAVVPCASAQDLRRKLLDATKPDAELQVVELSAVSGYMVGLVADQDKAAPVWEAAEKPRLISI